MHEPMNEPRPTARSSRRRAVSFAVALFYVLLFAALVWPIYPRFATIEPRVLEMPFGFFYVVAALLLSFAVLFAFYVWERGSSPDDDR